MYSDINCTLNTNSSRDLHLQPPRPSLLRSTSNSPFSGLVICVTGLSKEARKQVMHATERLGGQFSPHFHPKCTHLVVQSSHERKSDYASKHGAKDGLFIVTLVWFVDSVRKNVRLNESLYGVKSFGEDYMAKKDLNRNSCLPNAMVDNVKESKLIQRSRLHLEEKKRRGLMFSGESVYVDPDVSGELRNKVVEAAREEGGLLVNEWLVGQQATHVVCEVSSVGKYLGQSNNNLVTPLWFLKTVKEMRSQRLVHLSADLARHLGMTMQNVPGGNYQKDCDMIHNSRDIIKSSRKENQSIAMIAKTGLQTCQKLIKPSSPSILLDSISWIMSESSSTSYIYNNPFSSIDDDAKTSIPDACFVNFQQPLSEREKSKLIFGNHFITILFRVDWFREMGLCSRTFFSDTGFTCWQLLHHIYTFYQENMSTSEIELAIHADSRHADQLRSNYSNKEVVEVKHIDFLGSRRRFQMLKHITGDHNKNIYELLTRA
ncbi:uncharacterized protein LOC111893178 isoform X2 [Lactuca sativa]|uniref:uncharacterized protein LOC111893178 isoform X2 n=1 Tax=Lactuca sativa TaxID=4236 RepID=UPI000CD8887D|nr:uncharacterized protein LOC111893178 isoform X2 [Lactuca sativa]